MIKNWAYLRDNYPSHNNSSCTKRGFEIYDYLMSFNVEIWDYRK